VPTLKLNDKIFHIIKKSFMYFSAGGGDSDLAWYIADLRTARNSYINTVRNALGI